MSRVRRFDFSSNGVLATPVRLDNGFFKTEGRIAKTGIQIYRGADGQERRELRLPEEVFDAESLASFEQLPLTNNHPEQMLTADNAHKHAVGSVGRLRADGEYVAALVMITDADAIRAAQQGRSQLSNGYSCEMDDTQDPELTAKWGKYDSIQRKIRGNHVALCDVARAGPGARLRMDAGDAACGDFGDSTDPVVGSLQQEIVKMALKIDGQSFEVTDPNVQVAHDRALANAQKAGADQAAAEKNRADALELAKADVEGKLALLKADAEKMTMCDECGGAGKTDGEECKSCKGEGKMPWKADRADAIKRRIDREVAKGVKVRAALLVKAGEHLSAHVKLDDLSNTEIKKQVVLKLSPHLKDILESRKDEAFVDAAYELATANEKATAPRPIDIVRTVQDPAKTKSDAEPRDDIEKMDGEAVRDLMVARQRARNVKSSQA